MGKQENGKENDVNQTTPAAPETKVDIPKEPFFKRHPKLRKAGICAFKGVAAVGSIFGAAYAAISVWDSGRTYYEINLDSRRDGTYHIEDINPDLVSQGGIIETKE